MSVVFMMPPAAVRREVHRLEGVSGLSGRGAVVLSAASLSVIRLAIGVAANARRHSIL